MPKFLRDEQRILEAHIVAMHKDDGVLRAGERQLTVDAGGEVGGGLLEGGVGRGLHVERCEPDRKDADFLDLGDGEHVIVCPETLDRDRADIVPVSEWRGHCHGRDAGAEEMAASVGIGGSSASPGSRSVT